MLVRIYSTVEKHHNESKLLGAKYKKGTSFRLWLYVLTYTLGFPAFPFPPQFVPKKQHSMNCTLHCFRVKFNNDYNNDNNNRLSTFKATIYLLTRDCIG